jgi:acetate---CoA ligase (ADP-forming)
LSLDLAPLLAPRSIAVVGATSRRGAYADETLRNLRAIGFKGRVWGVHPTRPRVHGRVCFPSVADLPEPLDAVVVAIPAEGVPEVVEQAGERGCGGGVVYAAGFGETRDGVALEEALRAAATRHGMPVCGPNCDGVVALHEGAALWGDAFVPREPGPVAMISQSGNVAVNALAAKRGLRLHTVVSCGNQAVVDATDWLHAIAQRDGVRSVALFLESDGDGARLCEALAVCAEADVGVAVLKVGASAAGASAAAAHTGAVAGDHAAFRALCRRPARHGRTTCTSCSSWPRHWLSAGRGRAATAASRY